MAEAISITRRDIEARLIVQAWKDDAFAADLRRDPRGAIQRELGKLGISDVPLSEGIEVAVIEETPNKLYLVIPNKPADMDALSDEQLSQVAGGAGGLMQLVAYGAQDMQFPVGAIIKFE